MKTFTPKFNKSQGILFRSQLFPATFAVSSLFLISGLSAQAQTDSWNGSKANYSTAADWSTGVVPSETTNVAVSSGTVTYSDTNTGTSDYLLRSATTTISGTGVLNITDNRFEDANSGAASVTVSGSGTFDQEAGAYFVVAHAGVGSFTQTGGTVDSTVSDGWFLSDNAGSVGTYTLSGGVLNVTTTGTNGGGSTFGVQIGKNSGSDLFDIDGGTANFGTANTVDVRTYISNGASMKVDSGTATFNQYTFLTVGRASSTATSQLVVDGGNLAFTNLLNNGGTGGGISIGNGGAGQITLSSGTLTFDQSASLASGETDFVNVGDGANGKIVQSGGVFNTNMELVLSNKAGNAGEVDMSGGTLTASNIVEGVGDLATFDFTGGEIFLTGNQTSLVNDSWFDGIAGTTATFNSTTDVTEIFVQAVPEPSSIYLGMLAAGVLVVCGYRMKRSR